ITIICVLELRGKTSPGSCATSTASIPSDSTGAIGGMGHCFGAAIRAFSLMPMNIWRRWSLHSSKRRSGGTGQDARGLSLGEPSVLSLKAKGAPDWLDTREAIEQIGGRQVFHEFVLSGNEPSLRQYYEAKRQSPILGSETFLDRVRQRGESASREHPRYERRVVQAGPERVLHEIMGQYKVTREEIFRGVRGRENEARKVALYVIKRCCDRTLPEIAEYFGIGNYSTVSWSCRTVAAQMSREKNFRDRDERIIATIS